MHNVGMILEYVSPNGYSGKVYHKNGTGVYTLNIYNSKGECVLHSYRSAVDTLDKLKDTVNGFPSFLKLLGRDDLKEEDEDDGI